VVDPLAKPRIPVLITWDVDPTPEVTLPNKKRALERAAELLEEIRISSTVFVHARIAHSLCQELRAIVRAGHEIGCHGLTHGDEEEYDRMA
jgi:peptidoglycan/xylan/chitin deacetylase (PgdA/CDA1 family)